MISAHLNHKAPGKWANVCVCGLELAGSPRRRARPQITSLPPLNTARGTGEVHRCRSKKGCELARRSPHARRRSPF